ncbi:glycosyltransferase family 9 protein [Desulfosarcina sp.]|uniref:glycosyltransferase family 9 protein n=1 Tax=Desulfosarcina sp. TaxID=2027861 RepID=UPI003970B2FF
MRILLVQTSFLGDTILSTPVIAAIKNLFPHAELWMMTTPLSADLVRRDPLLAGVIRMDKRDRDAGLSGLLRMSRRLKSMAFDRVYSLHRSYRTSLLLWLARIPLRIGCRDAKGSFFYHRLKARDLTQHDVMRNLSILSGECEIDQAFAQMRLFPPNATEVNAELKHALPPVGRYAVLVPGSAWRTKMWHWEGYREVARYLLDRKIGVVILGGASEKAVCDQVARNLDVVNLAGCGTISEALFVMQHACVVVCNDSMALHMASALKIPTAVIFCATSPAFGYGPWQNRATVIEKKELPCKPCRRHGSLRCPTGTEACMRGPDASAVIDAVRQLMGR